MAPAWPTLDYDSWSATCDTLHAHTQLLGKLAVALAPPEPQLQHAALRLTARSNDPHQALTGVERPLNGARKAASTSAARVAAAK